MADPGLGYVLFVVICFSIARRFGRSRWFGFGLLFLQLVYWPILGFGSDAYISPDAEPRPAGE